MKTGEVRREIIRKLKKAKREQDNWFRELETYIRRQEIPFAMQQENSRAADAAMAQGRGPRGHGFSK